MITAYGPRLPIALAILALAACTPKDGFVVDLLVEDAYEWRQTEAYTTCIPVGVHPYITQLCTTQMHTYDYFDDEDYVVYLEDQKGRRGHVYVPRSLFEGLEMGGWFAGGEYPRYNHPRKVRVL